MTMDISNKERSVLKEPILQNLAEEDVSALQKYQDFFVGTSRLSALLKFEFITMFLSPMPGAMGFFLRKWFYPHLFNKVGSGILWGRNIALRHPGKIELGDRVAIDDDCLLDAKGAGDEGIQIGSDVMIARGSVIQGKCAWVKIGDRCNIGSQCILTSVGGIMLGKSVLIAGQCYIGGGRYRIDNKEIPIMDQGVYSKGPVIIEDNTWLGAGVVVLDGVRIGKGCVVGAGAVVTKDVPDYAIAVGVPAEVIKMREDNLNS